MGTSKGRNAIREAKNGPTRNGEPPTFGRMKETLQRIFQHIGRSWDDEEQPPHPLQRLLPPFFWDVFSVLVAGGIIYQIALYLLQSE